MELTENALAVLKKRYFKKDTKGNIIEDASQMLKRVSKNIAGGDKEKEKIFYDLMDKKYFLPNSPTLMNAGNDLQQLSACFVLPIQDSMESIFSAVKNAALIHKSGGGTGFSFSKLREKNSPVRTTSGVSSGPITFMKVFNSATDAVKQGGCLIPETLVNTANGTLYLSEICDCNNGGWKKHHLEVGTDNGFKKSKESYNNGIEKTLKIKTNNGFELCGTPNHKVKVFDNPRGRGGGLIWKKFEELKKDDKLYIKLGQHYGQKVKLETDIPIEHPNQKDCKLPDVLTSEIAFWLGYLFGDGFVATSKKDYRVGMSVNNDSYLIKEIEKITRELFNVPMTKYHKEEDNSTTFVINNKKLKLFLIKNSFDKKGSSQCSIPIKIRQSSQDIVGAFLRGLFEADGSIVHAYPALYTTSEKMAKEVGVLLRGLGIPNKISIKNNRTKSFGNKSVFLILVSSFIGLKRYIEKIGWNEKSRFAKLNLDKIDLKKEKNFPLQNYREIIDEVLEGITKQQTQHRPRGKGKHFTASSPQLRRSLLRYLRKDRKFSVSSYFYYYNKYEDFRKYAPKLDFFDYSDEVVDIYESGAQLTVDLAVEDNHTYLANGFVTHNTRRGANMAILNVDHPDILDFIRAKEDTTELNNFNISVGVTEQFMNAVQQDAKYELISPYSKKLVKEINARDVFSLIVYMAYKNGEPGIVFLDRLDRFNPTPAIGKIEATNPCVTGDTLVLTENGYQRIENLVGKNTKIFVDLITENKNCIKLAKPAEIFFTAEKEVIELKTKKGLSIKVTPDHKIFTDSGWKSAAQISKENKIFAYNGNIDFNENKSDVELGEILGWLVGDGWLSEGKNCRVGFTFGSSDREIMEYLTSKINKLYHLNSEIKPPKRDGNVYHLSYHSPEFVKTFKKFGVKSCKADKKEVPSLVLFGNMSYAKGFIKGIFSSDGYVNFVEDKSAEIRLTSKSRTLLEQTQLLLLKFNILSKIYNRSRPAKETFSYTTISGRVRIYKTDGILYELVISKKSVPKYLGQIGFLCSKNNEKIKLLKSKNYYSEDFSDKIISIEKFGMEKVYDIRNIETHSFIANGLVVHNCGEQPLLPNEACNLGSINLSLMVKNGEIDWDLLKQTVYDSTIFLDNVIERSAFPLPEIGKMAKANRKIGLGVMGWADMLVQLGVSYNSEQALDIAKEIMEFIDYHSKLQSMKLAQEKGSFPNFKDSIYARGKLNRRSTKLDWDKLKQDIKSNGIRNATTTTIAPTGTISMIADTSSGIEPLFSLVYMKNVMDGEKLVYVNKYFEKIAKDQNFYSKRLMEKISEKGALKNIKKVPDSIKKVFVTAHDISPDWHIKMQAVFQKYVDNAVSKTINFPHDAEKDDIHAAYELAFQLGCKGVTVYRDGSREEQVLNIGKRMREQEKTRIAPRQRPDSTIGVTKKINTGCGHLYVTINTDERGVCEIFTQMGKVGGCASAQLEAIARLISLALRSNIKVESIAKQIRAIRCPSPMWSKGKMILSCADGIANALEEFIAKDGNGLKNMLTYSEPSNSQTESSNPPAGGLGATCPECGASVEFKEGCKTCPFCGWSKCS